MAVLTAAEISDIMLDRANANATVDAPLVTAERFRFMNEAYADVWEIGGGATKRATNANAWNEASDPGTGFMTGKLTEVGEILRVWRSGTIGSLGRTNGDTELVKVDPARISHLRSWGGLAVASATPNGQVGEYAAAKVYAAQRHDAAAVAADANKFDIEVWPALTGVYYPIEYVLQFVPLAADSDVPNVTDIESRDIPLLAAARIAPLVDRGDLVQSILLDISERTQKVLERRLSALLEPRSDR